MFRLSNRISIIFRVGEVEVPSAWRSYNSGASGLSSRVGFSSRTDSRVSTPIFDLDKLPKVALPYLAEVWCVSNFYRWRNVITKLNIKLYIGGFIGHLVPVNTKKSCSMKQ